MGGGGNPPCSRRSYSCAVVVLVFPGRPPQRTSSRLIQEPPAAHRNTRVFSGGEGNLAGKQGENTPADTRGRIQEYLDVQEGDTEVREEVKKEK